MLCKAAKAYRENTKINKSTYHFCSFFLWGFLRGWGFLKLECLRDDTIKRCSIDTVGRRSRRRGQTKDDVVELFFLRGDEEKRARVDD